MAKSVPVPSNVGLTRRATEPTQLKNIAEFSNSTSGEQFFFGNFV